MNNTSWSRAELGTLRAELGKKKKMTMRKWAENVQSLFKNRSANSIRIKAAGLTDVIDSPPKILLLDIETLLMEVYVWGLMYNNYISHENIIKDWSLACWSAKWLFGSEIEGQSVTPEEAIGRQDGSILARIWELLNEADIVITQNGKKFDLPKLNARFLFAGFPPPMYYSVIDTKEVMKSTFGLSSNKLDYATTFLGIENKDHMIFDDWKRCLLGGKLGKQALNKMLEYNKKDVLIMEELYVRLRPWIKGHPNLNLYSIGDTNVCPNCGSTKIFWEGKYPTPLGLYRAFRCTRCGAIGRSTKKEFSIKKVKVQ